MREQVAPKGAGITYGRMLAIGFIIVAIGGFFAGRALYRFAERPAHPTAPIKMLFVGDMMFDRTMRSIAEFRGYDALFSCVADYTAGTTSAFDLVVGNLEGPITPYPSASRGTNPGEPGNTIFTFDPAVAPALAKANVRMLNLGNNHIFDFGRSGAESTMRSLDTAGISYFGALDKNAATTTINGYKIAFINYNQFLGESDPERTIQTIWKMRSENGFVAVYAHWGDEYQPETEVQRALAHRFIDAGADIVIGSHPHIIQSHEVYTGKNIYYSVGNFIFDQYWNESVRKGLGVEVTIGEDGKVEVIEKIIEGTNCLF